jgi:putative sugar O-methyltransferase
METKQSRIISYAKNKLYSIYIAISMPVSYILSPDLKQAYNATISLVEQPRVDIIDRALHTLCAKKAVDNYKIQKDENIPEIYRPGKMWGEILNGVKTYKTWNEQHDDTIMYDALFRFYRSDLIFGHSGDAYIWDIKNGSFDLKKQVYMIIKRYTDFISQNKSFDYNLITTTDIGQNIYVHFQGKKITFKIARFGYYLDRIMKNHLLSSSNVIIGELGAGSGELAILTKKVIPGCKYICFDLPETLMTSSYNILMTYPDLKIGLYEDFKTKEKITRQDIQQYDIVLLPNWCIERVEDNTLDLFINIGSMSEMDLPIIKNYIHHIERICKGYFYTINRNIKGIKEFGVEDIALEEFPFSENTRLISAEYDIASDIFHMRYGMDYQCNYWEYILKLR